MKTRVSVIINLLFIILILFAFFVNREILPINSKYLSQIVLYCILLLITFIGIKCFNNDKIKDFGFSTDEKIPVKTKRNALLIGSLIGIMANLILYYTVDYSDYLKGYNIIQKFTLALILGPIVEEIVFRGFIQTLIRITFTKRVNQKVIWLPIIITSIIFGLLHFTAIKQVSLEQTFGIIIFAFILGLLSGYYKEKFKSIAPSVYMHIAANFGGILFFTFMFFVSPVQIQKHFDRINKPTYYFDMNDSAKFMNSLIDFSIYEKNLPDSMRGKFQNIPVATLLTIDSTGKIVDIRLDSIRNQKYKITSEYYKSKALEVANKLPDFVPPKNLKGDTTILFYVSF